MGQFRRSLRPGPILVLRFGPARSLRSPQYLPTIIGGNRSGGVHGLLLSVYSIVRLARSQLRSSFDSLNGALAFGVLGALLSVLVHVL